MAKPDKNKLIQIVNECATRQEAADRLGVPVPTIYNWIRGLEGINPIKKSSKSKLGSKTSKPRMNGEEKSLWEAYWKDRSDENRNALAEFYDGWVEKITYRRLNALPNNVDKDSILQSAKIALLNLIPTYDGSTKFATYGASRIHGAATDEMRSVDIVPRLTRIREHKRKALLDAGKNPEDYMRRKDYEDSYPKTFDSIDRQVHETDSWKSVTIGDMLSKNSELTEFQKDEDFRHICRECTLEEQTILYLYYYRSKKMKEIGQVLDLTESRVSQIHGKIISRLANYTLEEVV